MTPHPQVARVAPAAVVLALVLAVDARAAVARPEVVAEVGRTIAVQGGPGSGGVSLGLSLLWPLETSFRAGVMAFLKTRSPLCV